MALLEKPHIKKIKASEGSGKSELDAQQNYVAQLLISKYSKRAPMVSFDVIPLGHEGVRKTKSNKFVNSIIAVCMKEGKEPALHAITFWDKEAQNISSSVEFGSLYKSVKLSQKRCVRSTPFILSQCSRANIRSGPAIPKEKCSTLAAR